MSALDVKVLKIDDLPDLPDEYPASMTWTERRHGVAKTVGGHELAAGKLVLLFLVSVVRGKAADIIALLKS